MNREWIRLKVPLPFALKWVNAYLAPEEDCGWTLIDPGLRTPETERFWEDALAERGIAPTDIRTIIVTHHHPDHYGLAGWFQRLTGAEVWLGAVGRAAAMRLWGEGETFTDELTAAFLRHGLPESLTTDMRGHLLSFRERVCPHPERVRALAPGESVKFGGARWEVLVGEGHAPGHLLFHDRTGARLVCGDQVLPDISPNIGWMPGGDPDPLGSYLRSLRMLRPLPVELAYPGHRNPFGQFGQRAAELLAHHEERLDRIAALLREQSMTAYELCVRLFGDRIAGNPHQLRFALAETIAHAIRLERSGAAGRTDGAVIRYAAD